MKVYIVLEYNGPYCKIFDVYLTRTSAEKRKERLLKERDCKSDTYHVIVKSIKGLGDIKYKEDKGKRIIEVINPKMKRK